MNDEGVVRLRHAIIMRAIKDYQDALVKYDKEMQNNRMGDVKFTPRQEQVMYLREQGLSYKDIAQKLGCGIHNVYGISKGIKRRINYGRGPDKYMVRRKINVMLELNDIRNFFFGEWFAQLCDIDPQKIIDHLENEHKKNKKENKKNS